MRNTQGRFKLPPDVSFEKQRLSYGWAYVFRHAQLGELGRIILQGRPDGRTHITGYVRNTCKKLSLQPIACLVAGLSVNGN